MEWYLQIAERKQLLCMNFILKIFLKNEEKLQVKKVIMSRFVLKEYLRASFGQKENYSRSKLRGIGSNEDQ